MAFRLSKLAIHLRHRKKCYIKSPVLIEVFLNTLIERSLEWLYSYSQNISMYA